MLNDFKQFVPSKTCLTCDGCCRFSAAQSIWRPRIADSERSGSGFAQFADKVFGQHSVGPDHSLLTVECQGSPLCYFLSPGTNTCGVYHTRPFECQLYPFLLTLTEGKTLVSLHLSCPYAQEHWGQEALNEYTAYLRDDFFQRPAIRTFLNKNTFLFGNYSEFEQELETCFEISFP